MKIDKVDKKLLEKHISSALTEDCFNNDVTSSLLLNTKKSTARNPSTLPDVARRPFSSDADEALAGQYLSDFTAKAYGKKFTNKKSFF